MRQRLAQRGFGRLDVARPQVERADVLMGQSVGRIELERATEDTHRVGGAARVPVRNAKRVQGLGVVLRERFEQRDGFRRGAGLRRGRCRA